MRWNASADTLEGKRFAVVLHLLSVRRNLRLRVRCFAADNSLLGQGLALLGSEHAAHVQQGPNHAPAGPVVLRQRLQPQGLDRRFVDERLREQRPALLVQVLPGLALGAQVGARGMRDLLDLCPLFGAGTDAVEQALHLPRVRHEQAAHLAHRGQGAGAAMHALRRRGRRLQQAAGQGQRSAGGQQAQRPKHDAGAGGGGVVALFRGRLWGGCCR